MRSKLALIFLCFGLQASDEPPSPHIGLCIMATGSYVEYAERVIHSARIFFMKGHKVTYFVFTDRDMQKADDVVVIKQDRLGWPLDTMMRFEIYAKHKALFDGVDYVFASDADMLFCAPVGKEILSDLVGTQHPGFVDKRGTYETNSKSLAYVAPNEGKIYFAGGFFGGKKEEFFALVTENSKKIRLDLREDLTAIWHDESHLNRYFIDHPPTKILSPSYCYPESKSLPYKKRLLALDKNHEELRK